VTRKNGAAQHFFLERTGVQTYIGFCGAQSETPARAERSIFFEEFAMRLSAVHAPTAASKFALPGIVDRLLAFAQSWLRRRAVLAELHGLDERTLADLRIYRGDFPAIAAGTYVREGGAHDVALKAEKTDQRVLPYY